MEPGHGHYLSAGTTRGFYKERQWEDGWVFNCGYGQRRGSTEVHWRLFTAEESGDRGTARSFMKDMESRGKSWECL